MSRLAVGAVALVAALSHGSWSAAQLVAPTTAPPEPALPWLGERIGVTPLERALVGTDPDARERAIQRLGEQGSPRALDLLVRALEPSGAAQSARERLLGVRALSGHAREPKVRQALLRVMTGISVSAERAEPLNALLRDSAALALAAANDPSAHEALATALRQPGRVALAAAAALAAHPPRDLALLLSSLRSATPELVWLLEELADERAFEPLREIVRRGAPELSARAALALTRLGNFETVELARTWTSARKKPALRLAAAEILLLSREPAGSELLAELLEDEATRADAQALAARAGSTNDDERLSTLARSGVRTDADAAAYALSLSPQPDASLELARLLSSEGSARRAVRALALRRAALGARMPDHLEGVMQRLYRSSNAQDRSVAAFALALSGKQRARTLLHSRDPVLVQAAARAALAVGITREAAALLARSPAGPTRSQLAIALVDVDARARVPQRLLLELVAEAGPASPIALFALGAHDSVTTRQTLVEHLASPDPELRAHAALGLHASLDSSVIALLEDAYSFEVDPAVRRAIVLAAALRPERVRRRLLELAARLDSSEAVRNLAALALSGVRPSVFSPGVGTCWLRLEGPAQPGLKAAKLRLPGGLTVPALADVDGVVALAGLPVGPVGVRLARDLTGRNAQAPESERW